VRCQKLKRIFSAQIWKFAEQTQLQGIFETDAVTPALVTLARTQYAQLWMIGSLSSPRAKGMIWLHPDQSMGSKV
jgi:hypothetical protein